MADYNSSLTAQEIESTLVGAVVYNKNTMLTEAQKAQARKNIGAGSSDSGLVILGYFDTLEDLQAGVESPSAGDAYGVGASYPYDIYIYDGLHSEWINNGNIRGADGKDGADGSDASVTAENIRAALGYTPGKMVHNLLDNSDFRNPVNQRGQTTYTAEGYTIDRWAMFVDIGTINVVSDGLELDATGNAITFTQLLEDSLWKEMVRSGKTYTLAIDYTVLASGPNDIDMFEHLKDNTVSNRRVMDKSLGRHTFISQFTPNTTDGDFKYSPFHLFCRLGNKIVLHTAAFFEGEYTAETLPEYQPKGYGAELAECQRYDLYVRSTSMIAVGAQAYASDKLYAYFPTPVTLRAAPAVSISGSLSAYSGHAITGVSHIGAWGENFVAVVFNYPELTVGGVYYIEANGGEASVRFNCNL